MCEGEKDEFLFKEGVFYCEEMICTIIYCASGVDVKNDCLQRYFCSISAHLRVGFCESNEGLLIRDAGLLGQSDPISKENELREASLREGGQLLIKHFYCKRVACVSALCVTVSLFANRPHRFRERCIASPHLCLPLFTCLSTSPHILSTSASLHRTS